MTDEAPAAPWTAEVVELAEQLERGLRGQRLSYATPAEGASALLPQLREIYLAVVPGAEGHGVAEFVARHLASELVAGSASRPTLSELARKAAFLLHSIQPRSAVFKTLTEVAASAYLRTAGGLAPYIDAGDLFELLRWRIWKLRPTYFGAKALTGKKARALLVAIAHRLAIDQIRRLGSGRFVPLPLDATEPAAEERDQLEEQNAPLLAEVRSAIDRLAESKPRWLVDLAVEALMESRARESILQDINSRFEAERRPTWSPGAFRVFLSRFRHQLRAELAVLVGT